MGIIASYQESTIDYPGKIGQILFTNGCNFRCGFCHNPELFSEENNKIDLEILLKNLKAKTKAGWYEGVCISGGEPTIHQDLPEFIKRLKDIGLKVKLDTNGSNPSMLKELIEKKLIDYVSMDIKSPRVQYQELTNSKINLEDIDKSIDLIKKLPNYEFRTTILPFFNRKDMKDIGNWMANPEKVKSYTLQQFNPENCYSLEYRNMKKTSKHIVEEFGELMKDYAEQVRTLVD